MSGPAAGLGTRAARGAVVTMTGQVGRIAVQVLSVVVLARLLLPSDYGLLAMVVAVVGVAEVFRDFGLSSAAIQAKNLSSVQRSNLFWINTGIGVLLACVAAAAAPLVADLYDEPRLVDMTRVLALTFVLNGLSTQYRADLNRRMLFMRLAVADTVGPATALVVAVCCALLGAGYWALVAQQLTQAAVMLVVVVANARWAPNLPRRHVDMEGLLRFGWNLVGTQLIGYAANNLDSVIIGSRFGAASLGSYNRAFQLLMTPLNQIRAPSTTVALPVLSRLQDERERFDFFVRRGQLALGYTLVPGLALVIGGAGPVTELFLGERWASVEPILRLLACAGIFQTLSYVGYWVYLAKGLTRDLFQYSLITAAIKVTCILVGSTWGVVGVAAGYALAPALAWPLSLWWLSRRADLSSRPLYGGAARIVLTGVVAAAGSATASVLTEGLPAYVGLGAAVIGTVLTVGVLLLVVRPVRRDVAALVTMGREAVRRRSTR
ncbi:lipopolysaccharide biosynthesis protein [Solicola sp. PLA-1-18]|uniref:lipopolysaccharide biosynthesis protein n=1 Tax=Solicola sp. PLA-1-18 TaxID=3380532 RepID=UPI003B8177E9